MSSKRNESPFREVRKKQTRRSTAIFSQAEMSVENVDSTATSGTYLDKKGNMNNLPEKDERGVSQSSPHSVAAVVPRAIIEDGAPSQKSMAKGIGKMVIWLESMDEKELLRVLTLSDVPFLASILAVSSWSSSTKGQADSTTEVAVGEYRMTRRPRSTVRIFCKRVWGICNVRPPREVEVYLPSIIFLSSWSASNLNLPISQIHSVFLQRVHRSGFNS